MTINKVGTVKKNGFISYGPVSNYFHDFPLKPEASRMATMKPEYHEGPEARKKFEQGMAKLLKAKKPLAKDTPKAIPKRKQGKTSKG